MAFNEKRDTYYDEVRSSPGARFLRGEMDWQKRRDANMANVSSFVSDSRAAATAASPSPISKTRPAPQNKDLTGPVSGLQVGSKEWLDSFKPTVAPAPAATPSLQPAPSAPGPAAIPSSQGRPIPAQTPRMVDLGASAEYGGGGRRLDTLASSFDKNGVPTYDNDSIRRMEERNGGAAPALGGERIAARPIAAAPPVQAPQVRMPATAMGAVIGDDFLYGPGGRRKATLTNDLASLGRGSPSMRRALMDQYQSETSNDAAAGRQREQLGASAQMQVTALQAAADNAALGQQGEDRRQGNALANAMALEGMRQTGENTRYARSLRQPVTTADGRMGFAGEDGVFTPYKDADGKPVLAPRPKVDMTGQVTPEKQLASYDAELKRLGELQATAPQEQRASIQQQLVKIQNLRDSIRGDGVRPAGVPADAEQAPDGHWYVAGPDGKRNMRVNY